MGFDEVDKVPYAFFVVGFGVLDRVYLVAAERLLVVGGRYNMSD